jgi:hypothetical protein
MGQKAQMLCLEQGYGVPRSLEGDVIEPPLDLQAMALWVASIAVCGDPKLMP